MVRIKVIRASRLLLWFAIVVLAAVLGLLAVRLLSPGQRPAVSPTANLVDAEQTDEAETEQVFASSAETGLPLDPSSDAIDIEIIPRPTARNKTISVLIYHTHTHEAYEQVAEDPYDALEAWRTRDADHSVVRVGEELAERLRHAGMEVVHDVTDHEGESLSTAYTRSLETLRGYTRRFDLYIDLHRDAYVEGTPRVHTSRDGQAMAPLMMLIGNGVGFDEKPYYEQNYAFAKALEQRINAVEPDLCKPVLVKNGRYNQNIGVFAILVEIGHNRNTLSEALASIPALSDALNELLLLSPDSALEAMMERYIRERPDPSN